MNKDKVVYLKQLTATPQLTESIKFIKQTLLEVENAVASTSNYHRRCRVMETMPVKVGSPSRWTSRVSSARRSTSQLCCSHRKTRESPVLEFR